MSGLYANQYSCQVPLALQTTSTGTILADALLFDASFWRVLNDGTVPLYFNLNACAGSTAAHQVRAGDNQEFYSLSSRYALATTSTSTDGNDYRKARVVALG